MQGNYGMTERGKRAVRIMTAAMIERRHAGSTSAHNRKKSSPAHWPAWTDAIVATVAA